MTEAAHSDKSDPSGGYNISSADVFCTNTIGNPALSVKIGILIFVKI